MVDSEKLVEKRLYDLCKINNGMCIKLVNLIGIPDRVCLFHGAKLAFVELKTTGKKPRKNQLIMHEKLRKLGFVVEVIDTIEGVENFIDKTIKSPSQC